MSNHKNGNWRTGNAYGRVGKDTFSIDGKSWDYRDPNNYDRRRTVQRNEDEGNQMLMNLPILFMIMRQVE